MRNRTLVRVVVWITVIALALTIAVGSLAVLGN